jgi:hypothetical protein
MIVHQLNDDTDSQGLEILKKGLSNITEEDLAVNYHPYFSEDPSNVFFLLKSGAYLKSAYFVIEDNGNFAASSGWRHLDDTTALFLSRTYIKKDYRKQYLLSKFLLPKMFEQAVAYEKFWITCTEQNRAIYQAFTNLSQGKKSGIFDGWPEEYKKFVPIGSKVVNNTVQYVAEYKK